MKKQPTISELDAVPRLLRAALILGSFLLAVGPAFSDFENTGSLANARIGHTATLLPNGMVLVAGGYNSNGDLASAELYDPASGIWAPTGSLATARYGHKATLLPNGLVLVAGGDETNAFAPLASAELYDPRSGTWSATGSLFLPRDGHTATLLPNGMVLAAGEGTDLMANVAITELYDPANGFWNRTGDFITARGGHTATLLPNGLVLVAGGDETNAFGTLVSAELYDSGSGTWSSSGSLATARELHTATLLLNGTVLVTGGFNLTIFTLASAELYDPASGTWAPTGSLATARLGHTATLLPNGKVLVAGGLDINFNPLASAELYESGPSPTPSPSPTATPSPTPTPSPELLNISTRARVLSGDNVLIGGFIITGNAPKKVILRAIGPSLTAVGITDPLADPILELHEPDGRVVTNDNWKDTQEAEIEATHIPPTNDNESAIVATLAPGAYTAIVSGKNSGTGVGLVEAYDLDQAADSTLANISTRGFVDTGDNVMIGGVIIGGDNSQVLVRAIGPELTAQGVSGALEDTTLELHDTGGNTIASNDDWKETQQADIEATRVPPTDDRESAILMTLTPGSYTAIVRGKYNTTGVALVEVYNVSP